MRELFSPSTEMGKREMEKQDLKTVDEDTFIFEVVPNKLTLDGHLLVPQPSSDPADPLVRYKLWYSGNTPELMHAERTGLRFGNTSSCSK